MTASAPAGSARGARPLFCLACLACLAGLSSCRSGCSSGEGGGDASSPIAASDAAAPPAIAPPRCSAEGDALPLPEAAWGALPAFGDAVEGPAGYVAAVTRDASGRRAAGVATIDRDLRAIDFLPLGTALPDDPPPRVARAGAAIVAAFVDRGAGDAGRVAPSLAVAVIDAGRARVVWRAAQPDNPELAFDLAASGGAIGVAWLEETTAASRVVAAAFDAAGAGVAGRGVDAGARAISDGADVDSPRLVARPGGFWAAWIATSPEPGPEAGAEGAAEPRAWGWVEAAPLDASARRAGDVRRLTSPRGHVATFDAAPDGDGLAVVARDALEVREGEGAKLLRAGMIRDATAAPASVFAAQVGRGVPDLEELAGGGWVAYSDAADRARWAPLAAGGAPSAEPELEDGRVLAAGERDGRNRLLVVRKRADAPGELRLISCKR